MPAEIDKQELLDAIENDGPRKVVQQYRHNLLPSRLLIDLYSDHPQHDVLLFLALYPTVPSQVLEDLTMACTDPEIQAAAATNPRCPHLLLIRMARSGPAPVRAALAANKLQNSKITTELFNDPSPIVRAALARNNAIAPSYREALATDTEPMVRSALAASPKLPDELIHVLSVDNSAVVRTQIHALAKVDPQRLVEWAESDDATVQHLLLTRKNLPSEIIDALAQSPAASVQAMVAPLRQAIPTELLARAESEEMEQRRDVANNPDLPVPIQHLLARDPQADVRAALAANPSIDEEVALGIAASNDPIACTALAQNPQLPRAAQIELCHHENENIRLQMAYRDDLSNELLDILVNQHDDLNLIGHLALRNITCAEIRTERIDQLLATSRPSLHRFAASAQTLSDHHVRKLMKCNAPSVRLVLCANPILTREALEALSQDWNSDVAQTAREQLVKRPSEDEASTTTDSETAEEPGLVSRIVRFFTE